MSRHVTGLAAALACALAGVAGWASGTAPEASVGVTEGSSPPKLLVLRDRRVVEGTIRFAQGGYEVDVAGGRVVVPESRVWFGARHRREAFEELRRRAPCRTADHHAELARWCLANGLYSDAGDELRVALDLEPEHVAARSLVKSLDSAVRTGTPAGGRLPGVKSRSGEETPGGLPAYAAEEFVTRVQPILSNRCGNAGCHGPASKNDFVVRPVRSSNPAFRRLTEANLAAVRGRIDVADPDSSPLLVAAREPGHGKLRKPLFPGPAGDEQFKALALWVRQVARAPRGTAASEKPDQKRSVPESTGDASPLALTGAEAASLGAAVPGSQGMPGPGSADAAGDLLRAVLSGERPDAFDPDEFNRRYGPGAGRTPTTASTGPTR